MKSKKYKALIKKGDGVASAKICRWCLTADDALDALPRDESGQYIVQKIFDFTGLQIEFSPGVPSYLCTMCEARLKKMYLFRWRCNEKNDLVDKFIKQQNTAKNESEVSKDHLDHSAEQTIGTELSIKTEVTSPDTAKDLHLNQQCLTVHQANRTYECCGKIPDDLFEAEENPIAIKSEYEEVDEQDSSQTNSTDVICQDREDPSATINTCVNDSCASESIRNGIATIDAGKHLKVDRKRKNDQEKTLHRLRSYKHRSNQRVNNDINRNAHKDKDKDKYQQCPHCPSKFAQYSTLKNHIRIHTGEKPFVCKICDQTFRTRSNLAQHSKIYHKDRNEQCPHCPSKFALRSTLQDHIRIHTGEKPLVCKICDQTFRTRSNLAQHLKIHHKDRNEQCPHCPSKFTLLSDLTNHIRTHTGDKPYTCKTCDNAYHSSSALTLHSKIHKKDEYRQCPYCSSKFPRLSTLKDHINIHTGVNSYACEICDQTFRSRSNLTRHKKLHNKDQYHQCPHCSSKFARSSALTDHIRVHTGERPFDCTICKKAFRSLTLLSAHSKTHKKNR